ncbi:MAG: hypothetical protein ABI822_11195 [Bryobacteraceae bacterium]
MRTLESTSEFFVGLDLGQKRDFTAFCVVERRVEKFDVKDRVSWDHLRRTRFHLRHLGRLPLGTPYPEVVERMVTMVQSGVLRGRCELVVDATGVGGPVVDLLRAARLGCPVVPVTITAETLRCAWERPGGCRSGI